MTRFILKIALICIILFLFYWINHLIPFNLDDLNYQFKIMPDASFSEKIFSVRDVCESLNNHYSVANGRLFANGVPQLFCGLWHNKEFYNVFATFMFLAFMLLLGKLALPQFHGLQLILPSIFSTFVYWILCSDPAACYFGVDFGMNYLYCPLVCMLYAYLLFYKESSNTLIQILTVIVGILAGWSHEEFCIGLGAAIFIWIVLRKAKIKLYKIISIVAFGVGAGFLIFAPSNFQRLSDSTQSNYFSVFARWITRGHFFVFLIILLVLLLKYRVIVFSFIRSNIPLITAWIASVIFICMIGISVYARMMLGIELVGTIIVIRLATSIWGNSMINKVSSWGALCFVFLLCMIIWKQEDASRGLWEIEHQGIDSSREYIEVAYHDPQTPSWLLKYVNPCEPIDELFMSQYERQFNKKVYYYKAEILQGAQSSAFHLSKNSPFYRVNDEFFTTTELEDTVMMQIDLGEPLNDIRSSIKRLKEKDPRPSIILAVPCQKVELTPTVIVTKLQIPVRDIYYSIDDINNIQEL